MSAMDPRRFHNANAGVSTMKVHILDRPLPKGKLEVSFSAFAFFFSEMVQYYQQRVENISDLEHRFLLCMHESI